MDCCLDRYNHVCLVLDDNLEHEYCTNSDSGFDNQNSDWITWTFQQQGQFIQKYDISKLSPIIDDTIKHCMYFLIFRINKQSRTT